jgi:hypothetical protein
MLGLDVPDGRGAVRESEDPIDDRDERPGLHKGGDLLQPYGVRPGLRDDDPWPGPSGEQRSSRE